MATAIAFRWVWNAKRSATVFIIYRFVFTLKNCQNYFQVHQQPPVSHLMDLLSRRAKHHRSSRDCPRRIVAGNAHIWHALIRSIYYASQHTTALPWAEALFGRQNIPCQVFLPQRNESNNLSIRARDFLKQRRRIRT